MTPDPTGSTHITPDPAWKLLAEFSLPKEADSDRLAGERITAVLKELGLSLATTERLKSVVAEAALKAVEWGSDSQHSQPICIRVLKLEQAVSGRNWGFFLIHKREAQGQTRPNEGIYFIDLFLYREDEVSQSPFTTGEVP